MNISLWSCLGENLNFFGRRRETGRGGKYNERGKILLLNPFQRLSCTERTILISRATRTRSNTIMILQRGIQTWIDVVVTSFHVRRRLAQVFFKRKIKINKKRKKFLLHGVIFRDNNFSNKKKKKSYHAEARHDCAPKDCEGCEGSASVACRFHEGLDSLVGADSRGRARNARNRPCKSRPGTVGRRAGSPGTSTAPTCSSPRPDPAPCVTPRAPPSRRLLPEIITRLNGREWKVE